MTSYEPVDLSVEKYVTTNDSQTDHSHVILDFVLTKDPFVVKYGPYNMADCKTYERHGMEKLCQ